MESPEGETKSVDYGDGEARVRSFCAGTGKLPVHGSKQQLNERIYAQIEAKGIWVPYNEVKTDIGQPNSALESPNTES